MAHQLDCYVIGTEDKGFWEMPGIQVKRHAARSNT